MVELWISETPVAFGAVILTSLAFLIYGAQIFVSQKMQEEYERYGMTRRQRNMVGSLQTSGAIALIIGIFYPILGLLAAVGFVIMMSIALLVRWKLHDSIVQSLPALVLLLANVWLCFTFYHWVNH